MLHDLRRTLATKIRFYGVPQRDVAKLLNHTTNTVTDRYDLYDMLSENPDTMNAWNLFLTKVTTDTTDDRSGGDCTPVIRAMHDVGFPSIFDHRRSRHETKAIYRRKDHLDPQRA